MSWEKVPMSEFLKHRDLRFKPKDKHIIDLRRIEKIDFSGNIITSTKPSNTDMILVKNGDLVISGINVEKGAMAVYQGKEDLTATIHYSSYEFDKAKINEEFLKALNGRLYYSGVIDISYDLFGLFMRKTGIFCSFCMRCIEMATEIVSEIYGRLMDRHHFYFFHVVSDGPSLQ